MAFNHKHLIDITEYSADDIMAILETAVKFKEVNERRIKQVPTLKGFTVVNMFNEPSTRTRSSFEMAEKRLSAASLNFGGISTSTVKGESLVDTVETLCSYKIDMIVVRDKHAGVPRKIADVSGVHVIDAGDGKHQHPTQALLDLYTIWQTQGPPRRPEGRRRRRHRALPRVRQPHPGAEDHGLRGHRHRPAHAAARTPRGARRRPRLAQHRRGAPRARRRVHAAHPARAPRGRAVPQPARVQHALRPHREAQQAHAARLHRRAIPAPSTAASSWIPLWPTTRSARSFSTRSMPAS